jgi:hypothetical protein
MVLGLDFRLGFIEMTARKHKHLLILLDGCSSEIMISIKML